MKRHLHLVLGLGVLAAQFVFGAEIPAKKAGSDYLRFHEKAKGAALQVGIISLQHKTTGAKVDLVGAVHIGDADYYRTLNKDFKKYDAVLYEMVKPKDLDPGKLNQGRKQSSVSFLQRFMKTQLDLAYQLDEVDYGPKNFVHADMTDKQFAKRQNARGEGMFQLMMRMMKEDMARQKGGNGAADISMGELMRALFSPTRAVDLKYLLARQFNELELRHSHRTQYRGPQGARKGNESRPEKSRHLLRRCPHAGHRKAHDQKYGLRAQSHQLAHRLGSAGEAEVNLFLRRLNAVEEFFPA
jgi:hypothetical protein